jgi:hypothetical protein
MVAEINQQVVGMCTAQILVSTAEGGPVALNRRFDGGKIKLVIGNVRL